MNHIQTTKQNQRIEQITERTLVIGSDIAKNNHVARAFNYRGIELGKRYLYTTERESLEGLLEWAEMLKQQYQMETVVLGVEPTGHYWFPLYHYLSGHGIQVVLVNPHHVHKSKELDDNSPTKNDTKDAKVIAKLVIDGRYTEPHLPEGIYADLRIYMNQREKLSGDLTRVKNRIHNWLDRFFPEYALVYKEWECKSSLISLKAFPLPSDVVQKGVVGIVATWKEKGISKGVGAKRAKQLYDMARQSIGLSEGSNAARYELSLDFSQYDLLEKQIEQVMHLVEELLESIPGAAEMKSIPGVGILTVAGFLAEVGNLANYQHSQQIVRLAGLSLWENSSGKHKGQTTINKRGRRRLRSLLYRAALPLVSKNEAFAALHVYFTTRNERPLKKKQSIIAICNKLIRVLFELGRNQKQYDPTRVLGPHREVLLSEAS